jgi:transposase-like protein
MLCRPRHNIHLIRNTFRLASKRDWDAIKRGVKPICTAVNAEAARAALDELAQTWGSRYAAIIRLWENAWAEFIPFLDYDIEIRQVLCSTNAIESLNARYRRAVFIDATVVKVRDRQVTNRPVYAAFGVKGRKHL